MKQVITTDKAPRAVGTYSQAVKSGNTVYLSGQVPLIPETMELVSGDIKANVRQVFENLSAVATAAGGSLSHIVKLNVYLLDMENFSEINEVVTEYFQAPFPARAVVAVKQLPLNAPVEVEAVMVLGE